MRGFQEILEGKHDDLPERRLLPEGHDRRRRRGGGKDADDGKKSETGRARSPRRRTARTSRTIRIATSDVRRRARTESLRWPTRKFPVEVLTPEGEVFNDEVEMVSTKTAVGSIGILANHQPLLAMLDPTELRLYKSESDVVRFAQGEGYLQVAGDARADPRRGGDRRRRELDTGELRGAAASGPRRSSRTPEEDTEEAGVAARDKRRWRGLPARSLRGAS